MANSQVMPADRAARAIELVAAPFRLIARYRDMLLSTTLVELRGQFAGSALGIFWLALGPLLLLSLYALIYAVVFRFRPSGMEQSEYVLYIFCGLVPFLAFSTALLSGASSVSLNKQILFNTVFPSELIPVRAVLISSTSLVVGLVLVIVADAVFGQLSTTVFLVPVVVVVQSMFSAGLAWMLSLVNLVARDIQQILSYTTIALMIVSPIAYTPEMMPPLLKPLVYGNPLSYFIVSYQNLIVMDRVPPLWVLSVGGGISVVTFVVGFVVFRKAKEVLFDYA